MDPLTLAILGGSALLGSGIGLWSADLEKRKTQEQLQRQKEQAWAKYELGKAYSDQQYAINRGEAQTGLAIQERRLGEDVDSSIGQFNTGLLAQAYGIQDARIQTASGIGASRAAEGMSGTRGNNANELTRAYQQTSLDRSIGLRYEQNGQALSGMLTQANRGAADITRERASWEAGGYRYESKTAQDDYNRKLADLGQADYQYAIDNAASWEDYALSALSGASSGLGLAGSITGALNLSGAGGSAGEGNPNFGVGGATGGVFGGYKTAFGTWFGTGLPQSTPLPGIAAPSSSWFTPPTGNPGLNMDFWS
jgi:hypothetical protein